MRASALFLVAGLLEIGGGYLVWLWMRRGFHLTVAIAGFLALATYGLVPALQAKENPFGRIYAAYGAVFIAMSVMWGWAIDRRPPDLRDWLGSGICLAGALVMMWPRAATP
jgi:small multidrug resistance family-3 protein